jgi:hypothetical protein
MSRKALDPDDTLLDADFASTRTVAQLRTIAKSMNISLTGITKKADIIKVLSTYPKKKVKAKPKGKSKKSAGLDTVYVFSVNSGNNGNIVINRIFRSLESAKEYFLGPFGPDIGKRRIEKALLTFSQPLEEHVEFDDTYFLTKYPLFG